MGAARDVGAARVAWQAREATEARKAATAREAAETREAAEAREAAERLVLERVWARVAPLLPPPAQRRLTHPGRRPVPDRVVLSVVLHVLREGIPWHTARTGELGCSGVTAWRRLRRWARAETWPEIREAVLAELDGPARRRAVRAFGSARTMAHDSAAYSGPAASAASPERYAPPRPRPDGGEDDDALVAAITRAVAAADDTVLAPLLKRLAGRADTRVVLRLGEALAVATTPEPPTPDTPEPSAPEPPDDTPRPGRHEPTGTPGPGRHEPASGARHHEPAPGARHREPAPSAGHRERATDADQRDRSNPAADQRDPADTPGPAHRERASGTGHRERAWSTGHREPSAPAAQPEPASTSVHARRSPETTSPTPTSVYRQSTRS
ncbi:transposase [Streptomyces sp. e14]|uniref:transposase n=1 Tax=Streptomyces sp. e14 TaxID=645465 RepID=UPI00067FB203|nr:transposase [Streptomyces sp. e14]